MSGRVMVRFMSLRTNNENTAHEVVTGSAHAVAFKGVAAGLATRKFDDGVSLASFGNQDVRPRADDAEAVHRIFAAESKLHLLALGDNDLGGPELEPFSDDVDDARARPLGRSSTWRTREEAQHQHGHKCTDAHNHPQNHHPRPTLTRWRFGNRPLWFRK